MSVTDLSGAEHFLLAIAGIVVSVCVPMASVWLRRQLHISATSAMSGALENAVAGGARLALSELGSLAAHNRTLQTHNAAVQTGARFVLDTAEAAVSAFHLTPDHVASLIDGEVAKILGAKPQPAAAPATPTPETPKG